MIWPKAWWINPVRLHIYPSQDVRCVCEQPQSCTPVNGQLCDNVSIFPLHLLYPVSMMMSSRHGGTPSGDMEHRGEEFRWGVWGRKKWRVGLRRGSRERSWNTQNIHNRPSSQANIEVIRYCTAGFPCFLLFLWQRCGQKQLGKQRAYLTKTSRSSAIHWGKSGQATGVRNHRGMLLAGLLTDLCFVGLLI